MSLCVMASAAPTNIDRTAMIHSIGCHDQRSAPSAT